jgi:hypothetical protein
MDLDGKENFCSLCGASRDHDLEGREVTWIGQDKLGSDLPKILYEILYALFRFCSDKILLRTVVQRHRT